MEVTHLSSRSVFLVDSQNRFPLSDGHETHSTVGMKKADWRPREGAEQHLFDRHGSNSKLDWPAATERSRSRPASQLRTWFLFSGVSCCRWQGVCTSYLSPRIEDVCRTRWGSTQSSEAAPGSKTQRLRGSWSRVPNPGKGITDTNHHEVSAFQLEGLFKFMN